MITIANTITIAITIAIAIAIFPISPGLDAHTHAHNRWEAALDSAGKSESEICSPQDPNCLPFLQNLSLQLSTP
jgi:hypothetical protein